VVYRYQLADEMRASAPGAALSDNRYDRQDANTFDIDRVQVNADYTVSERISWQTSLEGENLGGAARLYLKRAFVRFEEPFGLKTSTLRLGLLSHVIINSYNQLWGYRCISRDGLDRYLGVSNTWVGVGLTGRPIREMLEIDAAVANQLAYNKQAVLLDPQTNTTKETPSRSKYKTFMGRVTFTPLPGDENLKGLHLSLFAQMNATDPPRPDTSYVSLPPKASDNSNVWYEVFPHYRAGDFLAGFQYAVKQSKSTLQKNRGAPYSSKTTSRFVSGVMTCALTPRLGAFLRGDFYDPDTACKAAWTGSGFSPKITGLSTATLMAGVSHLYAKGVQGIIDIEVTKFENPKNAAGTQLSLDPDATVSARMILNL